MDTAARQELHQARQSGQAEFITTPTRVEATGLVIPPIRARTDHIGWRLEDDWCHETRDCRITVPEGWLTDLATLPGPLRKYVSSFQMGITGPLLHDYLYDHAGCLPEGSCEPWRSFTRREADEILCELMRAELVAAWRRHLAYGAIRLGGRKHWGEPNRARRDG